MVVEEPSPPSPPSRHHRLTETSNPIYLCSEISSSSPMRRSDHINSSLPDELLFEIFLLLDSKSTRGACSLVCKRWFDLERLTRTSLRISATGKPDLFVSLLAQRFVNVKSVRIDERLSISASPLPGRRPRHNHPRYPRKRKHEAEKKRTEGDLMEACCLSDSGLTIIGDRFSKLEKLSLVWCSNFSSQGLMSLAAKCVLLKSLDLQGCYVGDIGIAAVGKFCKQLEDLNLRFCEGLTDCGLVQVAFGCGKSLKTLGIAGCAKITDISLEAVGCYCKSLESLTLDSEFILNKGVIDVAKGCHLLKVLKLQCANVTDEALIAVGTSCASLELLACFQKFTDMGLTAIGVGCKKLKDLILCDCNFLSDKGLKSVAAGCKQLTHLEVNACHKIGTVGLESIGKSCPYLTDLALLYCQKIGNNGLLEVSRGCKFLQSLHLVDCSAIGDEAICSIAKGCTSLKKLHIRRCYEIGSKGIIAVGENCKFLTDLSLRFCDRIGDDGLIAIGNGCPLHYLNVSGCYNIGDDGIVAIARGCPELRYVDVSVLKKLGDLAMAELGKGCPLLKDIIISHCSEISDMGISHLVNNCRMMESCHMVYCAGITSAGVATIVSGCPNIKKVVVEKWKVSERTKRRAANILSFLCIDL